MPETCSPAVSLPSPAQDDMEEPINLGDWLVEHPAASYVMRVDGCSMAGAGINDGDLIVVSRAKKPRSGQIVVALVHGDRTPALSRPPTKQCACSRATFAPNNS